MLVASGALRRTLEDPKNTTAVSPGVIALKVTVETKPAEVLIPGLGIPPIKRMVPLVLE